MREEVALESTAIRSPTRVRTSRRWPAWTPRDLRRERQALGSVNIGKAEANCTVRAGVSNKRLDGCRDADG